MNELISALKVRVGETWEDLEAIKKVDDKGSTVESSLNLHVAVGRWMEARYCLEMVEAYEYE